MLADAHGQDARKPAVLAAYHWVNMNIIAKLIYKKPAFTRYFLPLYQNNTIKS
jgi:hypothetical protein